MIEKRKYFTINEPPFCRHHPTASRPVQPLSQRALAEKIEKNL
jgi:hypothetical protein